MEVTINKEVKNNKDVVFLIFTILIVGFSLLTYKTKNINQPQFYEKIDHNNYMISTTDTIYPLR